MLEKLIYFVILSVLISESYAAVDGRCECAGLRCVCCVEFPFNNMTQRACVNIDYNLEELKLTIQLLFNNENVITRVVGPDSFPLCAPVPSTPINLCLTARRVQLKPTSAKVCLTFSVRAGPLTLTSTPLPCLTFSDGQVAISQNK